MFFGTQTLLKAAWACQYYSHWKIGPVSPEMLWENVRNKYLTFPQKVAVVHTVMGQTCELWNILPICNVVLGFPNILNQPLNLKVFRHGQIPTRSNRCASPRPLRRCLLPTSYFLGWEVTHPIRDGTWDSTQLWERWQHLWSFWDVEFLKHPNLPYLFDFVCWIGQGESSCLIKTKASQCAGAVWFLCQSDEIQTNAGKRREYQNPKMPCIVGAVDACKCKSVTKSDNANSLAIIGRSALTLCKHWQHLCEMSN